MLSRSQRQEERGAKEHEGRRTPGSGNGWAVKNDVRNDLISYEYKYTDKMSYSLKLADLKKAERNALLDGREMAFVVEIQGRPFVIVPAMFYRDLERAYLDGNSG